MNGDKKTFIEGKNFYKEYTEIEYNFLNVLHNQESLKLYSITHDDGLKYIVMSKAKIIGIDTIPREKRRESAIQNIIVRNLEHMTKQMIKLNDLGIYYSDCLQWALIDSKLYLIDMDMAYLRPIEPCFDNLNLFEIFLDTFNINKKWLSEGRRLFFILNSQGDLLSDEDMQIYNQYNKGDASYSYAYYCKNTRHIQVKNGICIYAEEGNYFFTNERLNDLTVQEWELIRII